MITKAVHFCTEIGFSFASEMTLAVIVGSALKTRGTSDFRQQSHASITPDVAADG
jgi:hypothetical protein